MLWRWACDQDVADLMIYTLVWIPLENLVANRRNRCINRYGETENCCGDSLRLFGCIFIAFASFLFAVLAAFIRLFSGEIKLCIKTRGQNSTSTNKNSNTQTFF